MPTSDTLGTNERIQGDRQALRLFLARVRELRLHNNWTQAEMARRAGITRSAYQNFENGYGNITLKNLVRVFGVLGLTDRFARLVPSVQFEPTLKDLTRPKRQRARTSIVPRRKPKTQ